MLSKKAKRAMKDFFRTKNRHSLSKDPIAFSLMHFPRRLYDKDGQGWYDFGVYEDNGETDDEIQCYLDDEYHMSIPAYVDWDCTGRPFTQYLHWRRVPCGIAFVHRVNIDV